MPTFEMQGPDGKTFEIEAPHEQAAISAFQQMNSSAMSSAEKVEDVAKGTLGGLAKGAIGLAGLVPDISNIAHEAANKYLFDPVLNAISGPPKEGPAPPDINKMFGSQNIKSKVEGTVGHLPEAKTTIGKYAESIGEAVPGAVIGPGSAALKATIGVGTGIGSKAFGDQYAGTAFEPYAKLIGGIVGGGALPIAGSRGIEAVRNASAAKNAGEHIGDILGSEAIKSGAVNRLAKSAADDNITSAGVEATRKSLGKEAMLMDMGRQLQGRAEAVSVQPGKAQNIALDAVEGRTGQYGSGARERIGKTLDENLGESRNIVHLMDDVDSLVQKHAKPVYDQVMADHPVLNVPTEITSRPAVAQAMKNAEGLARNYGEKLSTQETRTILSGDGYHIADDVNVAAQPSLKYWDYVKKGLDQRIKGMMRNGVDDLSSAEKADLGGLLSAKKALVDHLDRVTNGAYADARRIAATKPELHEAQDFGRSIFNSKLLPEEVAAQISEMSIPAQAMAQAGARRELERVLDSVRNDGAKARNFLDTNNNRQKIANLFGEDAAKAIENRVAAENTFQNATETIARNSRTAVRQQLVKDTESTAPARIDATLTGLALKGAKSGLAYALEHGMENTRTGISRVLTARDHQISPIVRELLEYNAKKAANSGAPLKESLAALARALISDQQSQRLRR